jgi:hypothetical protein
MQNKIKSLLILLIIFNICVRIPYTPHEVGMDSFFTHWMAKSIINEKRPAWLLHPTSLMGLYPFSETSLAPYLLAILSVTTSLDVETIIYIVSLSISIYGLFFVFILTREISKNDLTAFYASFFFSLSPIFVNFTYWTMSARNLFMVLLPLFFFLTIRAWTQKRIEYLLLTLIVLITIFFTHQMYFLLPVLVIAPFISSIIYFHINKKLSYTFRKFIALMLVVMFFLLFFMQFTRIAIFGGQQFTYLSGRFFTAGTVEDYNQGKANKGIILLNMIIDYISRYGLMSMVIPVGFVIWLEKIKTNRINQGEFFIFTSIVFGGLIVISRAYGTLSYLPAFSIISAYGFQKIGEKIPEKNSSIAVASFLLVSILFLFCMNFNNIMNIKSLGNKAWMSEPEYASIKYLNKVDGVIIADGNGFRRRISSIAYKPVFPFITFSAGPDTLSYGITKKDDFEYIFRIRYSTGMDHFWRREPKFVIPNEHGQLQHNEIDSGIVKKIMEKYGLSYLVQNRDITQNNELPFYKSVEYSRDRIYDNSMIEVYSLD